MKEGTARARAWGIVLAVLLGLAVLLPAAGRKEAKQAQDGTKSGGPAGELIVPTAEEIMRSGYPVNENGETYGPDVKEYQFSPDLILVGGVDSVIGYIRPEEIPGADVHSPEEATAYMQGERKMTVPLYMQDGKTMIGEFQLGR